MMGIHQEQKPLFSYSVDLDQRVRADNPLRQIKERIDFSWVREEVANRYGYNGNISVDPQIIVKLLLLFYDNVKSERELMRIVPERLDYLWFLGLNLDDPVPDHSVLSKARTRWGREVFERLFIRTVGQCVRAGLVEGGKIHVDSSLIEAHASASNNLVNGSPELIAALREAYEVQDKKIYQPERHRSYQPKYKTVMSKTDPDAPMITHEKGPARPRYKSHRAVDDKKGVVTATEVTAASMHDGSCLLGLTHQHERHTGMEFETVVGDKHYGTRHNFRTLQALGKRTHMGVLRSTGQARIRGVFHFSEFTYDRKTDTFVCPAGERLRRRGYNKNESGWYYRAGKKICGPCPMQKHGFKRARWRRLWRQQIQDHLIAAIQNIKLLIKHTPQRSTVAQSRPFTSFFTSLLRIWPLKTPLQRVNVY